MQNTNLYKVLSKIDVIIKTITEDPTTTIELAPVDYNDYDFDSENGGGSGGSSSGGSGDSEDSGNLGGSGDVTLGDNLWADFVD